MLKSFRQVLRESLGIPRLAPLPVRELNHAGVETPAASGRVALVLKPPGPGARRPAGR